MEQLALKHELKFIYDYNAINHKYISKNNKWFIIVYY